MASMQTIETLARGIVQSSNPEYIKNWFGASGFMGTRAWHGPYYVHEDHAYFVCRHEWMGDTHYTAYKITEAGIDALENVAGDSRCRDMANAMRYIEADAA